MQQPCCQEASPGVDQYGPDEVAEEWCTDEQEAPGDGCLVPRGPVPTVGLVGQRQVDDEERHRGEQGSDQQAAACHETSLNETRPDRLLPKVRGQSPEEQKDGVEQGQVNPAVRGTGKGTGGGSDDHGEDR